MEKIIEALFNEGFDWHKTYDNSPAGLMLLDSSYTIIKANVTMSNMVGAKSVDELIGKKCYEVVRGADKHNRKCVNPHNSGNIQQLEIDCNGKILSVLEVPLYNKSGVVVGHTHTCYDITEQKNIQKEIIETKEKFEMIFYKLPMGVLVTDLLSRKILDVNDYFCQMLGYSKTELLARTTTDITHPDDCKISMDKIIQASKSKQDYNVTKRYVNKFGQPRWVYITVIPVLNSNGEILYAFSIVDDITDKINKS
jgi:PAS domain S-box-containing protein